MGFLIKFILFILVAGWILKAVLRLFAVGLFGQAQQQQQRNFNGGQQQQRPKEGNVNIDYAPKDQKTKKSSDNFKGGDYVDYEEVK